MAGPRMDRVDVFWAEVLTDKITRDSGTTGNRRLSVSRGIPCKAETRLKVVQFVIEAGSTVETRVARGR